MKTIINSLTIRIILSAYLCFNMAFFPIIPEVYAQIVVDPSSNGTNVTQSRGVDQVNIAAPSAAGVSHNKFQDYNVNERGVILNNSNFQTYDPHGKSVLSGEHVEFNRNFGPTGAPAKVILNEVTGNSVSSLRGTTEIYGHKADLIIANPNGITCVGCDFINNSKLSLITGTPNMMNGDIKDFSLSNVGIIRMEGSPEQRFALETMNSAVLVANAVQIAGAMNIEDTLTVITGDGKYDYTSGEVTSKAETNGNNTHLAIDAWGLGAMTAGQINIKVTQRGFGVNTPDNLIATTDGIEITADGNIAFKNIDTLGDMKIASGNNVTNKNGGHLYAAEDVNITGNKINLLSDYVTSDNDIYLKGRELMVSSGTDLVSSGKLLIDTGNRIDNRGNILSVDKLDIKTGSIVNTGLVFSESDLDIIAGGTVNNNANGVIASMSDIKIIANNLETSEDSEITASEKLMLLINNTVKSKGDIQAQGSGKILAKNIDNYGTIAFNEYTTINSNIENHGLIVSNEHL